jgi:hypothetical protein
LHLNQKAFALLVAVACGAGMHTGVAHAQSAGPDNDEDTSTESNGPPSRLWTDAKAYATSPLHWNGKDWAFFGGTLAAIGVAHHYDTDVRNHFTKNSPNAFNTKDTKELQDYLPAVAALGGTWLYAHLIGDNSGRTEAYNMVESAGFSIVTAYALKFATGRERPDETASPNQWRKGGSSFPSTHATVAFAIGTVLAESGNDDYRWVRRLIGYGIGAGTAYERMKHNAHWLSDTVAGAALGAASARFSMNRSAERDEGSSYSLSVTPVPGGAMLTYRATLR